MKSGMVGLREKYGSRAAGDLTQVLRQSRAKMKPALKRQSQLLYGYFNLINIAAMAAMNGEQHSKSKFVCANLLSRIAHDLLAMDSLSMNGLSTQCAVIAASTYECAVTIGAIGNDDAEAERWLSHTNLKTSIETVKELSKRTELNLHISLDLYDLYSQLCGPKHSNPVTQKHVGRDCCKKHEFCTAQYFFPTGSIRDQFLAGVSIEIALLMTNLAVQSFLENHLHCVNKSEFVQSLDELNKELEALLSVRVKE